MSDGRLKENISPIKNALSLVVKLQGVTYDLKKEYAGNNGLFINNTDAFKKIEAERHNIYGFVAQDVLKVIPELVTQDNPEDFYAIDYTKLVPVLVEAIKEQQKQINDLKINLEELMKQVNSKSQTIPK